MTDEDQRTKRPRISQETIAIVTVGVALAGLILVTTGDLRDEGRASRVAWQAESQHLRNEWQEESQQLRNEWQEESRQLRDEARADREAFQRESETFRREILRLTEGQAQLAAVVTPPPTGERVGEGTEQRTTSEPTARAIDCSAIGRRVLTERPSREDTAALDVHCALRGPSHSRTNRPTGRFPATSQTSRKSVDERVTAPRQRNASVGARHRAPSA